MPRDPYEVLGVSRSATREELHDAYRRLVKRHHPDRNGGSAESTRRFQEIQAAYEEIKSGPRPRPRPASPPPHDPVVEDRMADIERELREARERVESARRAARAAVGDVDDGRVETDDSFGKILADAADEVGERIRDARDHPAVKRVSDLIDGLEGLASRFGEKR